MPGIRLEAFRRKEARIRENGFAVIWREAQRKGWRVNRLVVLSDF